MAEKRMVCSLCGWEYDPATGVPKQGVKPGTPFSNLPDTFRCPKCGAMKKWFK